jgi:hypothetical protein
LPTRDSGGSETEYQDLVRELELLHNALQHLDKLNTATNPSPSLDSIKYAALSCRHPLEQILNKIQRYDKSLRLWAGYNMKSLRKTADKLRWALGQMDEIQILQSYINVHVGTINVLLAEHVLESMSIASAKAEAELAWAALLSF